jgi:two-component system C4-dicarboxylate transport response regulator DctD
MDRFRSLENESILLVENDPTIRDTLTAAFGRIGCRVKGFDSAEAGLVEFQSHSFSVVISDFKLPGMDGLTLLREVMTPGDNIVKILISGYADNKMVAEARKIDVDAVLEKPFTLESLFNVLKEKIEDRKASNGLSGCAVATRTETSNANTMSERTKGG